MTDGDSEVFAERLIAVGELFDAQLTEAKIALYFGALQDLALDQVLQALNEAVRRHTFMPKPAELRTLVLGTDDDATERAWLIFRAAASRLGAYSSVALEDPVLGGTIQGVFGSWVEACSQDLSPEMWAATRKAFGRVYRVKRQQAGNGVCYLPGLIERENRDRLDWQRYVPVGVINAEGQIRLLNGEAAESYRRQIDVHPSRQQLPACEPSPQGRP